MPHHPMSTTPRSPARWPLPLPELSVENDLDDSISMHGGSSLPRQRPDPRGSGAGKIRGGGSHSSGEQGRRCARTVDLFRFQNVKYKNFINHLHDVLNVVEK